MQGPNDVIIVAGWESASVQHAVNRAIQGMDGEWDATKEESRSQFLQVVREEGFPDVEVTYDPMEGTLPRVYVWPEGAPLR